MEKADISAKRLDSERASGVRRGWVESAAVRRCVAGAAQPPLGRRDRTGGRHGESRGDLVLGGLIGRGRRRSARLLLGEESPPSGMTKWGDGPADRTVM